MASYVKDLMRKKDEIEENIKTWYDILKTQGDVGMDSSLVDSAGYPRNDIDIIQIRTARKNIACFQNDHKAVMKQIEEGLAEYHAQISRMDTNGSEISMETMSSQETTSKLLPFAIIDLVSTVSPAESAGLKLGDQIIKFGSITKSNFIGLNTIGNVVKHSKGNTVNVVVKRENKQISIVLTPQEWSGRGLLGCNIVAL